jgi:hypothetical protein
MPITMPMRIETVTGVTFDMVASVQDMSVNRMNEGLPKVLPTQERTVGVTVTVVSQSGADGRPGAQGAPGANGAGANLTLDFDGPYTTDIGTESVLDPRTVNFALLPAGTLVMTVAGRGLAEGGATGTFRVRLGGTDAGVDGTILASLTVTASSWGTITASGTLTNPESNQLVKLSGLSSVAGLNVSLEGLSVSFVPA